MHPSAPWQIDPAAFPAHGSAEDRLRFLVGYAILAPSGHNTQPWRFRISGDQVDLYADRTRALPVVDPDDRALLMSNGAALAFLLAAAEGLGERTELTLLPTPSDRDHLASVRLQEQSRPAPHEIALRDAIVRRRTTRRPFDRAPLDARLIEDLRALGGDGASICLIVDDGLKRRVAALVAAGDRAQFADPAFRRELADWVRSRHHPARDGMSGANFGMPDPLSVLGAMAIRFTDMGRSIGDKDERLAAEAPLLALVSTDADTPRDWLQAGIVHARLLLEAAAAGLTAAYLNQPVEVGALRSQLAEAVGIAPALPQLLMRIGKGPIVEPAVRRPVEAVLIR